MPQQHLPLTEVSFTLWNLTKFTPFNWLTINNYHINASSSRVYIRFQMEQIRIHPVYILSNRMTITGQFMFYCNIEFNTNNFVAPFCVVFIFPFYLALFLFTKLKLVNCTFFCVVFLVLSLSFGFDGHVACCSYTRNREHNRHIDKKQRTTCVSEQSFFSSYFANDVVRWLHCTMACV